MKINYPTRCEILDVTGVEVLPGIIGATPDVSKKYIGKKGIAQKIGDNVLITLDNCHALWGYECWWTPI